MNVPAACFFDLDGVLLDTEPIHENAWRNTAKHYGKELSQQELNRIKGKRRIDCAKEIIKDLQPKIKFDEFMETHNSIVSKLIQKPKPINGAVDLLDFIACKKIPMALVSSSSSSSYKIKSQHHNWLDIFKIKILGDNKDLLEGKPFPDPYLLAAKKLAVDPKMTWAIEDSVSGMTSALRAGCKVWWLKNECSIEEETKNEKINYGENVFPINDLTEIKTKLTKLIQST